MISEGYERALFESPVLDRFALGESKQQGPEQESTRVFTKEFDFLRDLRRAAQVVKLVADSKDTLFNAVPRRHLRNVLVIQGTTLGASLMNLSHVTQEEMKLHFPHHGFNPYVDLLFKARKELPAGTEHRDWWKLASGDEAVRVAAQLNEFVSYLREKAAERSFSNLLDRFRRSCDKNTRSLRRYIDSIFRHRGSRHLVIRLELGYAMEEAWAAARPTSVTLAQAKEDLAKFQRYLRDHLPTTGFAAKLEYGLLRGYHFHALIFLNGHLMQRDVLIALRLGEHWRWVICEGRGRYWNCNAKHYHCRGIGMINYDDGDKRVALIDKVADYLTKTDFWLRYQPGGKKFFKGMMPQPRPKRGRPRESEEGVD
jgi:hypothetical protein